MKKSDSNVFIETVKQELRDLNSEISSIYAKKKMSYNEEWAASGFSGGNKIQLLFSFFTLQAKTKYLDSMTRHIGIINDTNNHFKEDDYQKLQNTYLEFSGLLPDYLKSDLINTIQSSTEGITTQIDLMVRNFKGQMNTLIENHIQTEKNYKKLKKDDPAIHQAKIANAIALAAFIVSVASVALSIVLFTISQK